jgi:hypothetical protein
MQTLLNSNFEHCMHHTISARWLLITLMMEAVSFPETSASIYHTTWGYVPAILKFYTFLTQRAKYQPVRPPVDVKWSTDFKMKWKAYRERQSVRQ